MDHLEGIAHQIAREARIAANCAQPGWAYSVSVPSALFVREVKQTQAVASYATRSDVPNELVRIDLDLHDIKTDLVALKLLLRMELEPFIIGVGQVRTRETAKGLMVLRAEERQEILLAHHDDSPQLVGATQP